MLTINLTKSPMIVQPHFGFVTNCDPGLSSFT